MVPTIYGEMWRNGVKKLEFWWRESLEDSLLSRGAQTVSYLLYRNLCFREITETPLLPARSSLTAAAYRDMKTDLLAEGSDHGTREIRETIKGECIDCQALCDVSNADRAVIFLYYGLSSYIT
jgi:hypothetical protein